MTHLKIIQGDCCIYSYGRECVTSIGIGSLAGGRMSVSLFYFKDYLYTDTRNSCIYNRLPEDKPLDSKHVEDIKNKKLKR